MGLGHCLNSGEQCRGVRIPDQRHRERTVGIAVHAFARRGRHGRRVPTQAVVLPRRLFVVGRVRERRPRGAVEGVCRRPGRRTRRQRRRQVRAWRGRGVGRQRRRNRAGRDHRCGHRLGGSGRRIGRGYTVTTAEVRQRRLRPPAEARPYEGHDQHHRYSRGNYPAGAWQWDLASTERFLDKPPAHSRHRNGETGQDQSLERTERLIEWAPQVETAQDQDWPVPQIERVADLAQEPDGHQSQQGAGPRSLGAGGYEHDARKRRDERGGSGVGHGLRIERQGNPHESRERKPACDRKQLPDRSANGLRSSSQRADAEREKASSGKLPGPGRQQVERRRR